MSAVSTRARLPGSSLDEGRTRIAYRLHVLLDVAHHHSATASHRGHEGRRVALHQGWLNVEQAIGEELLDLRPIDVPQEPNPLVWRALETPDVVAGIGAVADYDQWQRRLDAADTPRQVRAPPCPA